MPPTFPPDFFEEREIGSDVVEKEEQLDGDTYIDEPIEPIPPGCLIRENDKWLLPKNTTLRDKYRRICRYIRPAQDAQPFIKDNDTGCEYYLVEERCWKHYKIYAVFGPDEYLLFTFNADSSTRKKLIRFCPDSSVTDFGALTEQASFAPAGSTVQPGWVPPLEGGWIVAHGYGEKEKHYQEGDVCVLVLYIWIRQEPIIILDRIMLVRYKLMTKVEKRNCQTNALLSGYPRYEEVPGASEVTVRWRVGS